ncbi:hypothetical protein G6F42_014283 [Rhizopus arrhizus]|nr:hypothetical protein G6F42_014283 [Rhizopus arrhizus]
MEIQKRSPFPITFTVPEHKRKDILKEFIEKHGIKWTSKRLVCAPTQEASKILPREHQLLKNSTRQVCQLSLVSRNNFRRYIRDNLATDASFGLSIVHNDQMVHSDEIYDLYKKKCYKLAEDQQEPIKLWLAKLSEKGFQTFLGADFVNSYILLDSSGLGKSCYWFTPAVSALMQHIALQLLIKAFCIPSSPDILLAALGISKRSFRVGATKTEENYGRCELYRAWSNQQSVPGCQRSMVLITRCKSLDGKNHRSDQFGKYPQQCSSASKWHPPVEEHDVEKRRQYFRPEVDNILR